MKKSITILLLLCSMAVMGQTETIFGRLIQSGTNPLNSSVNAIIKQKSDTTVLNIGNKTHSHEWIYKKIMFSNGSCAVYHGEFGCPNNWSNDFRICQVCLRHENIRTTYYSVEVQDKYEEAVKKIKP